MNRLTRMLILLGALLTISGLCLMLFMGSDAPQAAPESAGTATATPSSTNASPLTTSSPTPVPQPTTTAPSPSTTPIPAPPATHKEELDVPAAPQRAALISAAKSFVRDLGTTRRSPKQWWQHLEPQLAPQAAEDMKGMEPSWMRPMTVKRGGWVVANDHEAGEGEHEHGAQLAVDVVVPTDIGDVTVTLRPAAQGSKHLVLQYRLPEEP